MLNKIFYFICLISLLSCSEITNDASEFKDSQSDFLATRIEKGIQNITEKDAQKVATLFKNRANPQSRSARMANEVEIVNDIESSTPLMYIVNYGNDDGFAIISATKNTYPILAYSETGSFDSSVYNEFFEDLKTYVHYSIQNKGDSLRKAYAIDWTTYEFPYSFPSSRANSTGSNLNTDQLIQNEITRKTAQGYTYIGKIAAAQVLFSEEEYTNLTTDISSHTDPAYDYREVSLLFIKDVAESAGPYFKTNWHQGVPFNVDAPNGQAGCVPIAIAQIAYYYKFPSKYDWSKIYVNPEKNDAFDYFIKDIRNLCNVSYEHYGTNSTFSDARNALTVLGYQNQDGGTPSFTSIKQHMLSKQGPIMMFGVRGVDLSGHAWVCDGFQIKNKSASISYISSERTLTGTPYEDYPIKIQSTTTELIHMNSGKGDTTTSWYLSLYEFPNDGFSMGDYYYMDQRALNIWK